MENTNTYIEILLDLLEIAELPQGPTFSEGAQAPQWMKDAASKGMKIKNEKDKVGQKRADQILNGSDIPLSTLKRLRSFINKRKDIEFGDPKSKEAKDLLIRGVPYSKKGVDRFSRWVEQNINRLEDKKKTYSETSSIISIPEWIKGNIKKTLTLRELLPEHQKCQNKKILGLADKLIDETADLSDIKKLKNEAIKEISKESLYLDSEEKCRRAQKIGLMGAEYSLGGLKTLIRWCETRLDKPI